jgi:hypothetical protein
MKNNPYAFALTVGAPLTLALLELFHPIPHDLFHVNLQRWMVVHYLQIFLFPLCALAVIVLLRRLSGFPVIMCRVAMFIFAVTYVAFDTAAGVVTGVLLLAAQASGVPDNWRVPILTVWTHPIVGGSGPFPVLAAVGSMAWTLGLLSAAFALRRVGISWIPVLLLIVSSLGMFIFKTHAWPGGPLSFGSLAASAAWLEFASLKRSPARLVTVGSED